MSQSHSTLMRYFKEAHGGKPAIARLVPGPLDEISLAYGLGVSRLVF